MLHVGGFRQRQQGRFEGTPTVNGQGRQKRLVDLPDRGQRAFQSATAFIGQAQLFGAAVVLGGVFTAMSVKLWLAPPPTLAMRVFTYSITYITLLFGAMALDQFVANAR